MARSDPKKYVQLYIEPFSRTFRNNGSYETYEIDGKIFMSNEGKKAAEECISEMTGTAPMGILKPQNGLAKAAKSHALSQSKTGTTGHNRADGKDFSAALSQYGTYSFIGESISYGMASARSIVIQLMVDDGVSSRGHRKNLLNTNFEFTGCGFTDTHTKHKYECVIDYAINWIDK